MKQITSILSLFLFTAIILTSCGDSQTTTDTNQTHEEQTNEDQTATPNEESSQYEKVRAIYVDFSFGDLPHYIFKTADGTKKLEFTQNNDRAVALEVEDDNGYQGFGINPELKDKTFDVYYKSEKVTPAGWDEADALDGNVIYKLEAVQ